MNVESLINCYADWIKNEFSVVKYGKYYELTTPFLDRFNDCLQVYIRQISDDKIIISDDSYILNNLIHAGFKLKPNSKRKYEIDRIIKVFSLELNGNAIVGTTTISNFPFKLHQFIQAMLAIDDMFEHTAENPKDFFIEDVITFFNAKAISFEKDFPLLGKTGSKYKYDFYFQNNKYCKAFSRITKQKRDMVIFNWLDTQETRNQKHGKSELYVLLNNINIANMEDLVALKNYDIKAVCFSDKAELVRILKS